MNNALFDISKLPDFTRYLPHHHWEVALKELYAALVCAEPGEMVVLVGPSRAGKTSLLMEAQKLIFDADSIQPGEQPIVNVIALNDGHNGSFDTKEFTLNMLDAINHPTYSLRANENSEDLRRQRYSRISESILKRALISGLRHRKTLFFCVDEGQHVRYATKIAKAPEAVLDSWKCMAQEVGFVLVLVGTYPMLNIIQRSPHLIGRKEQIHLPRYQWNEKDAPLFAEVVATYSSLLDSKGIQNNLMGSVQLLYRATFGCIGLLGRLIRIACTRAIIRNCPVDSKLIHEVMLSDSDLSVMKKECLEGELLLVKETYEPPRPNESSKPIQADSSPTKKRKGKPFQRKPEHMQKGHRATKERGRND